VERSITARRSAFSPPPRPLSGAAAVALLAALGVSLAAPVGAAEPTANVIEYFNAGLGHYFMTASPDEAAMLDAGTVVSGWTRTGVEFGAFASASDRADAVPVCRFFGTPGRGPNSHFYTADAAECASVRQNPDWTYEGLAFYIDAPQGGRCAAGTTPVYRSFHAGTSVGDSNHRFLVDLTMHEKMAPTSILEGVVMCSPLSAAQVEADAVRLLAQATFGQSDAAIAHVKAIGVVGFLAEQFAAPASAYASYKYVPAGQAATFCATDPDPTCARDYYSLFLVQNEFFRQALAAPDQLRQRVAFALSQIMVTSGLDVREAYAMARYQQIFRDGAFGNFEDLLKRVTLSPVMGDYLNMVNNDKPKGEVQPNENYARELMQLFSIGVWELAQDGTRLTDASGAAIPTYDQDEIEGYAHVFTGWTYPPLPGQPARPHNPKNYLADMVPVEANHDTGAKTLIDGAAAAPGLTASADLANAIHSIFMHPNVGPFIGRQLIQKLVTGDPTPRYVARVAAVFDDDGGGVRGDLKAVVKAILTDPEARGAVKLDPGYGKLREPVLYVTGIARALNAASDGVYLSQQSAALGQNLFNPASVFSDYPPDYVVPGTSSVGPEFAIQNSSTAINRYNFANGIAFGTIAPLATLPGATGTKPDWSALAAVAGDASGLVDRLDLLLLNRTMPAAMKAVVVAAVNAIPATDPTLRAKTALYLVATSSFHQVER
jgi:uncharacterized protein (DUF1800 family)